MSLQDAVNVLTDLAHARPTADRTMLICGALALDAVTWSCDGRDFADAAIGLRILATGKTLDLDEAGRQRAAFLSAEVRKLIHTEATRLLIPSSDDR